MRREEAIAVVRRAGQILWDLAPSIAAMGLTDPERLTQAVMGARAEARMIANAAQLWIEGRRSNEFSFQQGHLVSSVNRRPWEERLRGWQQLEHVTPLLLDVSLLAAADQLGLAGNDGRLELVRLIGQVNLAALTYGSRGNNESLQRVARHLQWIRLQLLQLLEHPEIDVSVQGQVPELRIIYRAQEAEEPTSMSWPLTPAETDVLSQEAGFEAHPQDRRAQRPDGWSAEPAPMASVRQEEVSIITAMLNSVHRTIQSAAQNQERQPRAEPSVETKVERLEGGALQVTCSSGKTRGRALLHPGLDPEGRAAFHFELQEGGNSHTQRELHRLMHQLGTSACMCSSPAVVGGMQRLASFEEGGLWSTLPGLGRGLPRSLKETLHRDLAERCRQANPATPEGL